MSSKPAPRLLVSDLDGVTFHTIAEGTVEAVRDEFAADHPVQAMISDALQHGDTVGTYELDGEEFTTRVFVYRN
jgi:hypothetical protein